MRPPLVLHIAMAPTAHSDRLAPPSLLSKKRNRTRREKAKSSRRVHRRYIHLVVYIYQRARLEALASECLEPSVARRSDESATRLIIMGGGGGVGTS